MSEVDRVQSVGDSGYKNRWGAGRFLYRQDGRKLTLKGKTLLGILAAFFLVSSALVLIRGPTRMDVRSPIVFNGVVSNVSTVEVPKAAERAIPDPKARQSFQGVTKHYSGMEVVGRPAIGEIPPGTVVKAKLSSQASNGLVKATLTEALVVNGDAIADSGTVIMGSGSSTEERLLVDFKKLVMKDGSAQKIRAQACNLDDQSIGLRGNKVGKYATMLAAGIALDVAGGVAEGLQESDVQGGVAVKKADLKNAVLNGAAKASLDQSKDIIEKWKQQKTIIQVDQGTDICVIFDGE